MPVGTMKYENGVWPGRVFPRAAIYKLATKLAGRISGFALCPFVSSRPRGERTCRIGTRQTRSAHARRDSAIASPQVVPAHLEDFLEHANGVPDGADLAGRAIVPVNGHFGDAKSSLAGDEEDFHVETPAVHGL
jgi:hypothetical protein